MNCENSDSHAEIILKTKYKEETKVFKTIDVLSLKTKTLFSTTWYLWLLANLQCITWKLQRVTSNQINISGPGRLRPTVLNRLRSPDNDGPDSNLTLAWTHVQNWADSEPLKLLCSSHSSTRFSPMYRPSFRPSLKEDIRPLFRARLSCQGKLSCEHNVLKLFSNDLSLSLCRTSSRGYRPPLTCPQVQSIHLEVCQSPPDRPRVWYKCKMTSFHFFFSPLSSSCWTYRKALWYQTTQIKLTWHLCSTH